MALLQSRFRRVVPLAILLAIAACLFAAVSARAVRSYQEVRNERRVAVGESVGVRPWMTLPYIARVYDVPETDLLAVLGLPPGDDYRHAPLRVIARRHGHDLDADIAALNEAIDARRATPRGPTTPATPRSSP